MDKRRGIKNIITSLTCKVFILVISIVLRRSIIECVGNDINGLNSLFTSIIGMLSVAELGVEVAISYCMYKPIVEGDDRKVAELYKLFRNLYLIIGAVIVLGGCIIMPFLPYLANGYENADVNLYLSFGMILLSVFISYVYGSRTSLINAYKNNYITTIISSSMCFLQYGLQIIVLYAFKSYLVFLLCQVLVTGVQFIVTETVAFKRHSKIFAIKCTIAKDTKKEVAKNMKAVFAHRVGNALINSTDSIIISSFLGVTILGLYSNYTTIVLSIVGVLNLFFTSMTSVVGHAFVSENKERVRRYFSLFHTFNFVLGAIFFLGYYAVVDNLVSVLFGAGLQVDKTVSFVIAVNYFIQFMRQSTMLFRDASGTFYYDRWRPIIEGCINIVLSILFVKLMGVEGVIIATIITNLGISHVVEPYVLHKHAFESSAKKFYIKNYIYIAAFVGALCCMHFAMIKTDRQIVEFFANGCISLAFSFVLSGVAILCNKGFIASLKNMIGSVFRRGQSGESEKAPITEEQGKDIKVMAELKSVDAETLKNVQLGILDAVTAFCDENGIKYWLDFGTLLGAVRHGGYIPWDDDIDISMLRADFEKFAKLFNEQNTRYKFCSYETDKSFYYAFGKVLDTKTLLYEPDKSGNKLAINIDIFPFDNVPDSKKAAKLYKKRARYNIMNTAMRHSGRARGNIIRRTAVKLLKAVTSILPRDYYIKRLVKNSKKYANVDTEQVGDFSGSMTSFVFEKSLFDEMREISFEGRTYKIPVAYDKLLSTYYGDYMTPPPEDERVSHHRFEAYLIEN